MIERYLGGCILSRVSILSFETIEKTNVLTYCMKQRITVFIFYYCCCLNMEAVLCK